MTGEQNPCKVQRGTEKNSAPTTIVLYRELLQFVELRLYLGSNVFAQGVADVRNA